MKTIHVIFKTHLDIGFTDTAKNVMNQYMQSFIPNAMAAAIALNEGKKQPEFIWTTGSYLIWEFLQRAEPKQVEQMRDCIRKGYIRWHGLPFTVHTELLDKKLLEFGITLSKELDAEFRYENHCIENDRCAGSYNRIGTDSQWMRYRISAFGSEPGF